MSNARNISDVFNNANTADNLTKLDGSAKLPDAVLPATLPAVDGSQLTGVVEARPTITSISPDTITNSQTSITVTGTNFVNGANIEAVATNGAIIQADTVTFNSSTSISAAFTITTDGTYYLRIENPDGNAVRSSTALLTVSDAPTWSTAAGSLGSMAAGGTANFTVSATSDSTVSYSVTSGALPGGLSLIVQQVQSQELRVVQLLKQLITLQ